MTNFNRIADKISKLSESQIQALFESMSNDNNILGSIIESLTSGILIADNDWIPIFSNKAGERFMQSGLWHDSPSENLRLFEITKDKNIAQFFKTCFELNKTNVSEEFTVATSNGTVRFVTVSVTPLVQNGRVSGNIIIIRDITEKRNQEILLRRMESLASLTNLAASVAHEIKNPLGAISIHIQLLQKSVAKARSSGGVLPDEKFLEKYLDIVNEEIDNLNKIVVDFLFAVRPVSAKLELLCPSDILKSLAEFLKPEYEAENIQLDIELDAEKTKLLLDEKLFREVIVNLSQNAIYAIKENSANISRGQFKIKAFVKDDKYLIELSDNGCGMTEETASKIFEPYYTTKASGTGLGLTTVYKIIKEFSGDITVKSAEGKGTVFCISLPVPQVTKRCLPYPGENEKDAQK